MHAWVVATPGPLASRPVRSVELPDPEPAAGELLVRVRACGVCRTDLHLAEGDLPPHHPATAPGHQVVGTVERLGPGTSRFAVGDRVGVAWLRSTCGVCHWCRAGAENLCPGSRYTGWDCHGGFAELTTVPAAFAYRVPAAYDDVTAAPLLCAGIIGYRALERARVPAGGRLGVYGFGSSAHLTAQIALARGAELYVMTRGERSRALAHETGAAWVGGAEDRPPEPLDSAIVFAPAGPLVPLALEALAPGGTLALAGIHMTPLPRLDHQRHLFGERDLRTVTSNTRRDGEELLRLAARLPLRVHTTTYGFTEVDRALADLAAGRYAGSGVVTVDDPPPA